MLIIDIFYLIIIVGCIIFYVMYVDIFSFYLLLLVLILPVLLFAALIYAKKKLIMELDCTVKSCTVGGVSPVILTVKNNSLLSIACLKLTVSYKNLLDGAQSSMVIHTPVYSRNEQKICLKISSEYCGMIDVSVSKARIYDMLRLFSFKLNTKNMSTSFMLCPKVYPVEPQIALHQNSQSFGENYSKRYAGDDPSEIFQLHEYRPGDKMNRIHWKASVRQDELIVKDYSRPLANDIAFIICSPKRNEPLESYNRILSAAASLSFYLLENDANHTFIWSVGKDNEYCTVDSSEGYLSFLASNLSTELRKNDCFKAVSSYFHDTDNGAAPRFSHIIVLTDNCDKELFTDLSADISECTKTILCVLPPYEDIPDISADKDIDIVYISGEEGISVLSDIVI